MSYGILPGDRVAFTPAYYRGWWEEHKDTALRLARKRGEAVTVDAHPKGDVVMVRWRGVPDALAAVEARHLRVWRPKQPAPPPEPVRMMKRGKTKAAMAKLPVGGVLIAKAYVKPAYNGRHDVAPSIYRHAKDFGYTLEVLGYAEHAGKPVAFLRRTA